MMPYLKIWLLVILESADAEEDLSKLLCMVTFLSIIHIYNKFFNYLLIYVQITTAKELTSDYNL